MLTLLPSPVLGRGAGGEGGPGRIGIVKILDLGLALLGTDQPAAGELTSAGQAVGTADYMAPEQVSDAHSEGADDKQAREQQAACARQLGVPVEITNSIGMKLALIPSGEFEMGCRRSSSTWSCGCTATTKCGGTCFRASCRSTGCGLPGPIGWA
jgi:serine/threonine protein kinase